MTRSHVGRDYRDYVVTDPDLFRPVEVNLLLGDATEAEMNLGWKPNITFEALVREMVDADCRASGIELRRPAVRRAQRSQALCGFCRLFYGGGERTLPTNSAGNGAGIPAAGRA
ncbi:MAG: GDP-mannose 4,6-dehydratase [Bryobacteraceae bacterium]